jgi:coproporphyrinogen III oxidase-like Fe-S oxidoreductase
LLTPSARTLAAAVDEYVSTVCADIALHAPPAELRTPLRTVYFGGGTPSLLPPPQLGRMLDALRRAFGVAPDAEVSMEMDPGA